jgi:serine-type D-Ala-D-Ala carboxypeptidase/endopeptidase (penicillin-binding protein 4)
MRVIYLFFWLLGWQQFVFGQDISAKLKRSMDVLLADSQFRYAAVGFEVRDLESGKLVYAHQPNLGLAPASTQKIFTSIAAYDRLGSSFQYETKYWLRGKAVDGVWEGDLVVQGVGDPSLGSNRFPSTQPKSCFNQLVSAFKQLNIKVWRGQMICLSDYSHQAIPDGWIWQDMGNYYGAGAFGFNWCENQYDLVLSSTHQLGSLVQVGPPNQDRFQREIVAAEKGSGDQAFVYLPIGLDKPLLKGSIPIAENRFVIAGAMADPWKQFRTACLKNLQQAGIQMEAPTSHAAELPMTPLLSLKSPVLDSLQFYFLRKSINLYGEAFVKTMLAKTTQRPIDTEQGVQLLVQYWRERGIDPGAIQIMDGSGLSPQNRVTAHALVQALEYARKQPWYASFYHALPIYNQMKLKSGSIGGARAFAGYHRSTSGKDYSIAIIVNNYTGSSSSIVRKLYLVLDQLK